ncbi:MAG TPA: hypothetical protein VFW94_02115 [Candidatus Acidoferrales bacterium]|nr:hypothetical protein [Candidatus Acidoferrales bacterium]
MTIFIRNKLIPEEGALKLAPARHDHRVKHLVKTWNDAIFEHYFNGREEFQKAVRRNRKILQPGDKTFIVRREYKEFFIGKNFEFSTKADGREETLYFEDAQRTGRLRQQHDGGPLGKIDHQRRIRLFLPEDRFRQLKKWRKRNKEKFPTFHRGELEPTDKTHHIEFAWDGVNVE